MKLIILFLLWIVVLANVSWALTQIKTIAGQRCCILTPVKPFEEQKPPLILIGGTAQSIASWEIHIPYISPSNDRLIIVYECLGQGPKCTDIRDVSLRRQAEVLYQVLQKLLFEKPNESTPIQIDIAGFSLGGRVALAYASIYGIDSLIITRKLHLTGVGSSLQSTTGHYGNLILQHWINTLRNSDNLTPFAWAVLMHTYSPSFLTKNMDRIQKWIEFIVQENSRDGIIALLEQTHGIDGWRVNDLAERIVKTRLSLTNRCDNSFSIRLLRGKLDQLCSENDTIMLQKIFRSSTCVPSNKNEDITCSIGEVDDCGHGVPMESARAWRKDMMTFINDS